MTQPSAMSGRVAVLGYGLVAYALFLVVFLYTIGFLANTGVPKGIDDGPDGAVWLAVVVDAALLGLFAVQHSVMARPWFKRWWTRFVPEPIERSTFVLAASLVLALLLWQWRPLPETVWSVELPLASALLWTLYGLGWVIVLTSTFAIDHLDLFGMRQVTAHARGHDYRDTGFRQPLLYRLVRHPIMVGFLIVFWATPEMSYGHLLFAILGTGYILIAVRFEEHDLRKRFGKPYEEYTGRVPRFVPALTRAPTPKTGANR